MGPRPPTLAPTGPGEEHGRVEPPPGDVTIDSYDTAADRYRATEGLRDAALLGFLARFARSVAPGPVLELGSGTGRDAAELERLGVEVVRTDATPAFVDAFRAAGQDARRLDARHDDLGGPYAGVVALATLLHLTRTECQAFLHRAVRAVVVGGQLACTLKEGDGEAWSDAKLGLPRYFVYWREDAVRTALATAGWTDVSVDRVTGRREPWLFVRATRPVPPRLEGDRT